ncbi:hypothetical protein ACFL5V_08405 [Fibrobacterota bacterium]
MVNNSTTNYYGSGLWVADSRVWVKNSIFWGNRGNSDVYFEGDYCSVSDNALVMTYSISQVTSWPGEGNSMEDPLLADTANGDFHLKSEYGRWDPNTSGWVADDVTSPALDAGDLSGIARNRFHVSCHTNPVTGQTVIRYQVKAGRVWVTVHDMKGGLVETFISGQPAFGGPSSQVTWNHGSRAAGIYLVRLMAGEYRAVRKIMLTE